MAQLSDVEIFQAALGAGFTPDQAVTMTAIALAESGGQTTALNSTGEHSVGLWQINTAVHDWDPSVAEDPLSNARMAYEVSGGGADITRWTVTHEVSGARYLAFRDRAEQAAAAAGHAEAAGQWDPPLDYYEKGVGAAPVGSTSTAVHTPGDIAASAVDVPLAAAPEPTPTSSFDQDGDGVFDAVEAFLGEDLAGVESPAGGEPPRLQQQQYSQGPEVDPDDLMNGQVEEELLASVTGGTDSLLAGAPANSWNAMAAAAAADGIDITYSDAYRPLHDQHRMVDKYGLYSQGGRAAVPGTSNHGLGLAVDVNVSGRPDVKAWLEEHADEYGWEANVAGEPWHYEYNEDLDPVPDRAGFSGDVEPEEPASVFDRDRDGIFDSVEAWLGIDTVEDAVASESDHGHGHGAGHEDHTPADAGHTADDAGHTADDAGPPVEPAPLPEPAAPAEAIAVDPAHELPPLAPAPDDELAAILQNVDLDPANPIVVEDLAGDVRADLERALADLAGSRTGIDIDPHDFSHQFENVLQEHDGVLDHDVFDDLTGLFGLDADS